MPSRTNSVVCQRGVTLIETMVAVLLLSIGVLGLMSSQANAILNSSSAKYRTDASLLVNQLFGTLWSNRQTIETTPAQFAHHATGGTGAGRCAPTGAAATHAAVTAWLGDVQATLPGAVSTAQQVRVEANQLVTVTICWQAPGDATWRNHIEVAQLVGSPIN